MSARAVDSSPRQFQRGHPSHPPRQSERIRRDVRMNSERARPGRPLCAKASGELFEQCPRAPSSRHSRVSSSRVFPMACREASRAQGTRYAKAHRADRLAGSAQWDRLCPWWRRRNRTTASFARLGHGTGGLMAHDAMFVDDAPLDSEHALPGHRPSSSRHRRRSYPRNPGWP